MTQAQAVIEKLKDYLRKFLGTTEETYSPSKKVKFYTEEEKGSYLMAAEREEEFKKS